MVWIITIVVLLSAGAFAGAWFAARRMVQGLAAPAMPGEQPEASPSGQAENKSLAEPEYFTLRSPYGYMLSCALYPCENSEKAIVLCHDFGSSKEELSEYVRMFLERGITVLAFDQRGHGETGGPPSSFGYYETFDARECVNYLENTLGSQRRIGVWGIGLGAAAAAELAKRDHRICFAILDSCYAELAPLLTMVFKDKYKRFYCKTMLPFLSMVNRREYGWRFTDVSPARGLGKTALPLLIIHGAADRVVGMEHAYRFTLERRDARLVIFPKAEHGACRASNPAEYRRIVQQFLIASNF